MQFVKGGPDIPETERDGHAAETGISPASVLEGHHLV